MPRSDKPINSGNRLDAPVSASRAHAWRKHGGPETTDGFRGAPTSTEVTVDDITVVTADVPGAVSKWDQRGTSSHLPPGGDEDVQPVVRDVEVRKEWTVVRSVEGRSYHRRDEARFVEVPI
jgi:hypothetical protein